MVSSGRRRVLLILGVPLTLIITGALFIFRPASGSLSVSHAAPATSFDDATQRLTARVRHETGILDICRTRLLSHGQKTARVIVFVHGYTSCPEQFAILAGQFFDDGANVLMVPLPLHGLPDRMTGRHAELTAGQLVQYADEVVDIAQGLGDHVTVSGLSAGGLITGWVAQNRADVDLAVLISPVFGYQVVPPAFTHPAANVFTLLPDKFEWWDSAAKETMGPDYAYPRYSRRALAQLLHLASAVMSDARRNDAEAGRIIMVTNAGDHLISSARIEQLVRSWRRESAEKVTTYQFPASVGVGHDLIDPTRPDQNTEVVYAKLRELMKNTGGG